MGSDHGVVVCRLCQRHGKANNFAGEGYRCARPVTVPLIFSLCAAFTALLASAACSVQCLRTANTPDMKGAGPRAAGRASAARWWTT